MSVSYPPSCILFTLLSKILRNDSNKLTKWRIFTTHPFERNDYDLH